MIGLEQIWGACGFSVGVIIATICMIIAAAVDDMGRERGDEE